jgi:GT2 family glycosyltransferase/glycosyltransferase involved in cell wall biosynthesis
LSGSPDGACEVSIVIPVLDKLEFTRQCLDRIWRNSGTGISYEIIVVDNGSRDGTPAWFADTRGWPSAVRYHRNPANVGFAKANNIGVGLARGRDVLFLNNDTLVEPGWLDGMVRVLRSNRSVGIVGIKQLFPYTNVIYHTGVVFAHGGVPQHLYPHLDASLPHVNQERAYQAVTGACLLIPRALFQEVGGFDEGYLNGYEDTDLCMSVARRGRAIMCCTSSFIYHYGQISEGRTADDDANAARFAQKWAGQIRVDQDEYLARDRARFGPVAPPPARAARDLADDCIYLADDLRDGSAQTWVAADLAIALNDLGVPVAVNGGGVSPTLPAAARKRLERLAFKGRPVGGVQIRWTHYRPRHLHREIAGAVDLEFFVINYLFRTPGREPWDYWLQSVRHDGHHKLPVSGFCKSVLEQIGVADDAADVVPHGYSPEIAEIGPSGRKDSTFRFLTVTNSHDLGRYNTEAVLAAYDAAFTASDDVTLVVKDYGASSGDTTLRKRLAERRGTARIEYLAEFTDKRELIRLYRSTDAFVSAHRGEGFGMKILDAMACGLPVIAPLFGGSTEYCTAGNSRAVEFSLVPMVDCLDTRALHITNEPIWAEVDVASLRDAMRGTRDAPEEARRLGARAQADVLERFTWTRAAATLVEVVDRLRSRRPARSAPAATPHSLRTERSPYWLGLRVSVIIPTRNRRDKLATCLDALAKQSILPQEFEVVVVDDGSTDGTPEWLDGRSYPFRLRCFRQEGQGPGAARNLGVERAEGELVLFIGDDIYAEERLLEAHLQAHARHGSPGTAILGHIDWPAGTTPTTVMDYVCGDAMLQFAYSYIPTAPTLDHRFFYTSNISLRRQFLTDAALAGVRFDPSFYHAAFEDSELAYRLIPRGLDIRYAPDARAAHDHWMDLASFRERERRAGAMAVVFYRKHPGLDDQLQVRWIADLVEPAAALTRQPDLLARLESFDRETDTLLGSFAASLDGLMAIRRGTDVDARPAVPAENVRAALHSIFAVIFDVERARGKLTEWFAAADDQDAARAGRILASVVRKIEFLTSGAGQVDRRLAATLDPGSLAELRGRLAQIPGMPTGAARGSARRLLGSPALAARLVAIDRFLEARLAAAMGPAWGNRYRNIRLRLRRFLLG